MKRYTKEGLIKKLQQFEKKFGCSPTVKKWNEEGFSPHSRTISRKFGTWSASLRKAGLDLNSSEPQSSKICCCTNCGTQFKRIVSQIKKSENLFCGSSCAASYNNSHRKIGRSLKGRVGLGIASTSEHSLVDSGQVITPNFCLGCGSQIMTRERAKYCSQTCCQTYQNLLRASDAIHNPDKVGKITLKSLIREDRGRKCEICNRTTWNGKKIPLDMDHVDGNPENNSLDNLRLICPNCHAQTPTYKGKNKGNGRHYRRVRYAEGKSY